ncbi:AAA family ATPase [Tsukamurella sp. NPDC003166]|uniref:AAA family ATPase n=1 Tax=Tsukamurella sp. NPDC003166 TaxID=3154444 RepID=UPI0033AE7B27
MTPPGDWHVDRLVVENFRCFERLEVTFDPSCTVLVGVNGSGKTAILDALAIVLSTIVRAFDGDTRGFGRDDAREIVGDLTSESAVAQMEAVYPVEARAEGMIAGSPYRWRRSRSSSRGRTTWSDDGGVGLASSRIWRGSAKNIESAPMLPVIALYGVERLVGVRRASGEIARSRSGAYDSTLDGRSDLSRLSSFIEALTLSVFVANEHGAEATAGRAQLEAIRLACNGVLADTGWGDPRWNPVVNELTLAHPRHGTLPMSFLSSGIRITAGLVIDLVSRAARANPRFGAGELLSRTPGIVLVDEVDLHLHPTWQQRILPLLRETFPRVQFIVTTHSPQVLSTVEAESIRIIDGNTVHHADYAAGLRSDVILQRILATDPEPDLPINEDLERYVRLVDQGEGRSDRARRLRRIVDEELGGVTNVPQLADADASIAFYDLDD